MNIIIDQFEPKLKDVSTNTARVMNTIKNYQSDIYVFPELCLSGYFYTDKKDLEPIAIPSSHPFFNLIQFISSSESKIISLGFPEKEGDSIYNSVITFFPDASQSYIYRKTHLFYKENLVFKPGNTGYKVTECNTHGIRIGTMICYDWRFPEVTRKLALEGADLILCPSNLVTDKWQNAMATRAIENKVYIAVANRIGKEKSGEEQLEFNGSSSFYNPEGEILAQASPFRKSIIKAEFEYASAQDKSINQFNDIFTDRRPEMYALN